MTALAKVLHDALTLSTNDRAKLAVELLVNLEADAYGDPEPEPEAEAAWAEELEKRADRALGGESQGKDAALVHEKVRESLRARR